MNMRRRRLATTLRNSIACLVCAVSTVVQSQGLPGAEREKAKVVSRMYQVTSGAQERCRSSPTTSANLDKEVDQFRRAYSELSNLIDGSPYLPQARERFNAFLSSAAARPSDESLVRECAGIAEMLRQFAETPGGRQAADEMLQTLKK